MDTKVLWFDDALGVFFIIGLVVIYIPQYYKIIKLQSSLGFSLWFMFLGHTASFLSCINATVYYIGSWWLCHGALNCIQALMGFGILIFQWLMYWIQYILFLRYYPKPDPDSSESEQIRAKSFRKQVLITFVGSHVIMIVSTLCTIGLFIKYDWVGATSPSMKSWSRFIDSLISIMFLFHYVPQIVETIRLQSAGSISLISLGMMCPGSFLWTYFLATQGSATGNQRAHDPAVWVPYLLVAISQACLLCFCLYFEYREAFKEWYQRRRGGYNLLVLAQEDEDVIPLDAGVGFIPCNCNS